MKVRISKGPGSIIVDEKEEYVRKIEQLQEQLNEANEVIKQYAWDSGYWESGYHYKDSFFADVYINKWGVK